MERREELQKLIVVLFKNGHFEKSPTAQQIYQEVREHRPELIRSERVRGFKSFVKILNSFEIVEQERKVKPFVYKCV